MKAIEQYFPVALFIMLLKKVLALSLRIKFWSSTTQMKTIEPYLPVAM